MYLCKVSGRYRLDGARWRSAYLISYLVNNLPLYRYVPSKVGQADLK